MGAALLHAQDLMPWPSKIQAGTGRFGIGQNFRVSFTGYREPRLDAAAARLVSRLERKSGMTIAAAQDGPSLAVECGGASARVQNLREDESYRLEITPQSARLSAPNPLGVMHGFETFYQLAGQGPDGFGAPATTIDDQPRFPWRGLMLDVSRHWIPAGVIKRELDAMAAVKLNVFHWHLTDDQGFRVESKKYPKLHTMASDGLYFTQQQIRDIVAYARDRGIRVVPELEMPGHTTAILVAYPELGTVSGPFQLIRTWGIFDDVIDPSKEEVYKFLDGLIGEMAGLFPDEYFHVGGDEVNGKQWSASARVQEFKRAHNMKDNHDFQSYFTRRLLPIVQKHGKKMIGWDEILHPDLPKDIVVHSWRGQKSLAQAATQGYMGILSSGYYLDLYQHTDRHYAVDPLEGPTADLTPEQQKRILGGEACMWAEHITPEIEDARVWPRNAAIAERLWSPESVKEVDSMYRRMEAVSRDLDFMGLQHNRAYMLMTARLAGSHEAAPVRVLAAVVEPVKGYARNAARKYLQSTPQNRMVDTARPESATARAFGKQVDAFVASKAGAEEIRRQLVAWRDNDARLAPSLETALLSEVGPISKDLASLAAAGLEAVDFVQAGNHAPADWSARQAETITRARQPRAELLLSVLPPLQKLIEAAK